MLFANRDMDVYLSVNWNPGTAARAHRAHGFYLTNRPQFSMVYTLIDHRNDVIKCSKFKWNHKPQADGFTAKLARIKSRIIFTAKSARIKCRIIFGGSKIQVTFPQVRVQVSTGHHDEINSVKSVS